MQVKAAMGKVTITPEELVPLQGYNPETHIADPGKDLLDELYARVLLEEGNQRKILVSVDCCLTNEITVQVADPRGRSDCYREFIPTFPQGTRRRWAEAGGTDLDGISVHATHTHTAPAHYSEKYTERIEALIRQLTERLVPIRLSVGEGVSSISAFRRPTLRADLSVPVNQTLRVLYLESEDLQPIGAIVNYAVHPTGLRNPATRLSGDIVGLAVAGVERQFRHEFTVMFIQGFSGDICPLFGDNGPTEDTYPDVVKGSSRLSEDIHQAIVGRKNVAITDFRSLSRTVEFPTREGFNKDAMEVTFFGISLGDVFILAVSGEVFNDYISKLEQVSPFPFTLYSGLANGYSGYLPTYKAFHDRLGGYEMNTTPYTDKLEELFMKEAGALMRILHNR
ncbi:hypothetical protein [Paenibacillus cremeus]|uniref:Neutral/alkaline non-lysosomal ceramidase N-terminal domain-containing protein n=1 Tax=Paenibacillus cremeus TaxID=2163881 RepID=A0A559JRC0_9BACL|nr:hypothetical protein [Paenibacillus cremeus]TVY02410.1 hypothetical protein FPZ49_31640 [Paenibacillus cremeus]